ERRWILASRNKAAHLAAIRRTVTVLAFPFDSFVFFRASGVDAARFARERNHGDGVGVCVCHVQRRLIGAERQALGASTDERIFSKPYVDALDLTVRFRIDNRNAVGVGVHDEEASPARIQLHRGRMAFYRDVRQGMIRFARINHGDRWIRPTRNIDLRRLGRAFERKRYDSVRRTELSGARSAQVYASELASVADITDYPEAVAEIVGCVKRVAVFTNSKAGGIDGRPVAIVTRRIRCSSEPGDVDKRRFNRGAGTA